MKFSINLTTNEALFNENDFQDANEEMLFNNTFIEAISNFSNLEDTDIKVLRLSETFENNNFNLELSFVPNSNWLDVICEYDDFEECQCLDCDCDKKYKEENEKFINDLYE